MSGVCRGCAGTGVGQHIPSRIVQLIEASMDVELRRKRTTFLRITQRSASTQNYGPLAHIVQRVEHYLADGWQPATRSAWFVDELLANHREWACRWCHGTGVPQLSVHALEIGVL